MFQQQYYDHIINMPCQKVHIVHKYYTYTTDMESGLSHAPTYFNFSILECGISLHLNLAFLQCSTTICQAN